MAGWHVSVLEPPSARRRVNHPTRCRLPPQTSHREEAAVVAPATLLPPVPRAAQRLLLRGEDVAVRVAATVVQFGQLWWEEHQ